MRRRTAARLAATSLVLAAGCDFLALLDPADPNVEPVAASLVVDWTQGNPGHRLQFEGAVYGYVERSGGLFRRFLDAGTVLVAGRETERVYRRAAEPEYRFKGPVDPVNGYVDVEMSGSAAVPPCALRVSLPGLDLPAYGGPVERTRDLLLPLGISTDGALTARAAVRVQSLADGSRVYLEIAPLRGDVVVPGALLSRLPAGAADLQVGVLWEGYGNAAATAGECPASVLSRTGYVAAWRIVLR